MEESRTTAKKASGFWRWATASIIFRLVLIYSPTDLNLSSRPEVSTPVTSLRRLAEGYWLKQASMSPYTGSMYHGSPLLLSVLGPLIVNRVEEQPNHILCSLFFHRRPYYCNTYSINRPESASGLSSKFEITGPWQNLGEFRDFIIWRYRWSCVLVESFHHHHMSGLIYNPDRESCDRFVPLLEPVRVRSWKILP